MALDDDEAVCHACGARWPERKLVDKTVPEAPKPQARQLMMPENRSTALTRFSDVAILRLSRVTDSMIKALVERLKSAEVSRVEERIDTRFNHPNLFALFTLSVILGLKIWFALGRLYQNWDGYVYLLNARAFASGSYAPPNYFEVLRPPLYPFMISKVWQLFGESTVVTVIISPIFTVAAAALLYLLVKEMFDARAGLIGSVGFLLSPIIMSNTDAVLVHGVGVFFLTFAIFSLWRARTEPIYYLIGGAASALASLTRYPNMIIAFVAVIFILIDLKDNPQKRRTILTRVLLGVVVFVGLWLPWLWWCQVVYHDPLISLKLAGTSGLGDSSPGHWYFYLVALPTLLTLPGVGLLLLGLVTKDWLKDRRRLLLAASFIVFLSFYSTWSNQDLRYMVEWAPFLFAIIGIGVSTFFVFPRTRGIYIRKILTISLSAVVGIWLILLILGSVAAEMPALSLASYSGGTSVFGSVDGFQRSTTLLQQYMNEYDIGVSDLSPYFSYYTRRFFYDWRYVLDVTAQKHITLKDAMVLLHIKYAVFRDYFIRTNNINSLAFLVQVQAFDSFSIYQLAQ